MSVDEYTPDWAKEPRPTAEVDAQPALPLWREALLAALFAGAVVGTAVLLANQPVHFAPVARPDEPGDEDLVDDNVSVTPADELAAATRLGVDVDASADVVRAALREQMTAAQIHPDQGGDHDEAAELIAAKNLLYARARRRERDEESRSTNAERSR